METTVRLFRMDVSKHPVTFEDRADGRYVIGLPIMRPGTWNGETYSGADLDGVAQAFAQVRDLDSFAPAIKPLHTYNEQGKPIPFDARDTLGRWTDVRTDEAGTLLGDARVLDPSLEEGLVSGKLQFLSAELWPNLRVAATGETVPLALVGAAFVDHPGVKGLPWEVIVNSADFPAQRKGVESMSWYDGVKALLGKLGASEDDLATLGDPAQSEGGDVQTHDAKPQEKGPDDLPEPVKRQLEMLQAQVKANDETIRKMADEARLDKAQTFAEQLSAEGYVSPALKPAVFALAERLLQDTEPVRVLSASADGGEPKAEQQETIALLGALLRGNGKRVSTTPRGLAYDGSEDPQHVDPIDDKTADELVALVGGGGE